jgi:serine/threonine protein kinase
MSDPLIGKVLGDYTIVELLGRGGMARVYRGYDGKLNRYAAVKVIDTEIENEELREEFQARFVREARAIARLQHPSIVGVYQFDQLWDLNFMAMQFVEGEDLRYILEDLHNRNKVLPPETILSIMRDIASALDYAHTQGVIHRDVKPSNIMVTPEGRGVLTDFGLVLNVEDGTLGNTFGSAHYIAPEQAVSSAQSVPESDLYSLGVVLYEMATGKVPFDDPSTMSVALKHLNEPPPLPSSINPDISPALEDVILHMLRKAPADRYASGAEFTAALTDAIGPEAPEEDEDDTAELLVTRSQPRRSKSRGEDRQTLPLPDSSVGPSAAAPVISSPRGKPETDTYVPSANEGGAGRRGLWILLALVLVASLIGALALSGNLPGLGLGGTSTPEAVAALPTELTQSAATDLPAAAAATTTAPATSLPTDLPTNTALLPSATPRPTETTPPTAVPPSVAPAASGTGDILLVYDGDSLLLVNQAPYDIDVDPLLLQAVDPDSGQLLDFAVSDLRGGATPTDALPPDTCFHIWRMNLNVNPAAMPYESVCATRGAWRAVSPPHWFWISSEPGAAFDVLLFGQVIATCPIDAGRCEFSIPS